MDERGEPTAYLVELLDKIAKSNGFVSHTIEVETAPGHVDGFQGIMTPLAISGVKQESGGETPVKLRLLCKSASTNAQRRQEFFSEQFFAREAHMYSKILPIFDQFQKDKQLPESKCFSAYPKCYEAVIDADNEKFIVIMENLEPQGFSLWPKSDVIPVGHAFLLVENLAKFHAISFAMNDQQPNVFAELKNIEDLVNVYLQKESTMKMFHMGIDKAIAALTSPKHIEAVKHIRQYAYEYFYECVKGSGCQRFGIIGHGDFWCNNILYRYADTERKHPDGCCFVDWQLSRYSSPALDLHFFIATSTDGAFRVQHFWNLMQHYHKSLSTAIRDLGSDPDQLFSFDDFKNDLKKFGNFGIFYGLAMTQILFTDIPHGDELTEDLTSSGKQKDVFAINDADNSSKHDKRINELLTDYFDMGYFTPLSKS